MIIAVDADDAFWTAAASDYCQSAAAARCHGTTSGLSTYVLLYIRLFDHEPIMNAGYAVPD